MEPLLIIIVPGVIGGVFVALLTALRRRAEAAPPIGRSGEQPVASTRLEPPSPHLINMARIRVAGGGGLGMVAMAITVAIFVPRIRFTMTLAMLLGAGLAAVLVAVRRRRGPFPSSNHPGAHVMLPLDTSSSGASGERNGSRHLNQKLAPLSARV